MYNDDEELTVSEIEALAALPRELPPGDLLEERVVRELRREGHFTSGRSRARLNSAWRIAAAVALFTGGVATGRYLMTPDASRAATVVPVELRESTATQVDRSGSLVAVREMWL